MNKLNNPKISIIIPVYGVQDYISQCLESVLAQSFTEFECLIINDGTEDNSIIIAKNIVDSDSRFIFLDKENGGQGSARNMGLEYARGDYIAFIDSDDYIEPNYLKAMYEKIIDANADICTCDVRYIDTAGKQLRLFNNNPDGYLQSNDYLMAQWHISNFMWDKLFKAELFYGVRFNTEMKTNEDVYLLFELVYGKKITSVPECLYNYLQRPYATSKGAPASFIDDRIKIKDKQFEFAKRLGKLDSDADYVNFVYLKHFLFVTIITITRYSNHFKNDVTKINGVIDKKYFNCKELLKFMRSNPKLGFLLFFYKISPLCFRTFTKFWFRKSTF